MMRVLSVFAIVTIISSIPLLADEIFYKTEARPGDGIYSILRRYDLDDHSCNFSKFYTLNKLSKNSILRAGRQYYLPILIYDFNGKTIRSTIGVDDWDLAVRNQKYNEAMLEKNLRESSFKKDNVLWVPFHELNCPKGDLAIADPVEEDPEEIPQPKKISDIKSGKRVFPIFGASHAYTPLISNKLRGKVYYIIAGHGGPDPGAIGKMGRVKLCEDEYAYDVALRLCRHLIAHGATAYMINRDNNDGIRSGKFLKCDADEVLWGDVRMVRHHKTRLFQRSDIVNDLYKKHRLQGVSSQLSVIIHVDSRFKNEQTDLYFYHHPDSDESKKIAQKLRAKILEKYNENQKNRKYTGTVTARDLHMLRETKTNSIYVELANIRNPVGQQRIILERNRQLLADWLFAGLYYQ